MLGDAAICGEPSATPQAVAASRNMGCSSFHLALVLRCLELWAVYTDKSLLITRKQLYANRGVRYRMKAGISVDFSFIRETATTKQMVPQHCCNRAYQAPTGCKHREKEHRITHVKLRWASPIQTQQVRWSCPQVNT